jgi:primosomal protein N' (replication factor Y)
MKHRETILKVALKAPVPGFFDYLVPRQSDRVPMAGQRVRVPFGRSSRVGVIAEIADHTDVPRDRLRHADEILDTAPLLDSELLHLLSWACTYYHHPPGDVFLAALPAALRKGAEVKTPVEIRWRVTDAGNGLDIEPLQKRAPVQAKIMAALLAAKEALAPEQLREINSSWQRICTQLQDKGYVEAITVNTETAAAPPTATAPDSI